MKESNSVEIAAREVVAIWHDVRLLDRKGPRLSVAIERLARALEPHPRIADALGWLEERDNMLTTGAAGGFGVHSGSCSG